MTEEKNDTSISQKELESSLVHYLNRVISSFSNIPSFVFALQKNNTELFFDLVKYNESYLNPSDYQTAIYYKTALNQTISDMEKYFPDSKLYAEKKDDIKDVSDILDLLDIWIDSGISVFKPEELGEQIVFNYTLSFSLSVGNIPNRDVIKHIVLSAITDGLDPIQRITTLTMATKYLKMTENE